MSKGHRMDIPETVIHRLQDAGERLTIQRRMVIEALCRAEKHWTINDIQAYLRRQYAGQELSDPTVYRILQWLKDLRIISQTDMGDVGVVYQLIEDPPHHHLVCLNCGQIIDVDDDLFTDLRRRLREEYHFEPRIEHMAIYGYCQGCEEDSET